MEGKMKLMTRRGRRRKQLGLNNSQNLITEESSNTKTLKLKPRKLSQSALVHKTTIKAANMTTRKQLVYGHAVEVRSESLKSNELTYNVETISGVQQKTEDKDGPNTFVVTTPVAPARTTTLADVKTREQSDTDEDIMEIEMDHDKETIEGPGAPVLGTQQDVNMSKVSDSRLEEDDDIKDVPETIDAAPMERNNMVSAKNNTPCLEIEELSVLKQPESHSSGIKVFVQNKAGFSESNRDVEGRSNRETNTVVRASAILTAVSFQQTWSRTMLFFHGVVAGVAMCHMIMVISLVSSGSASLVHSLHTLLALKMHSTYYFLLTLSLLSCFDRLDCGQGNKPARRHNILAALLLYLVSFCLTFVAQHVLTGSQHEASSWHHVVCARDVAVFLAWGLVSCSHCSDALEQNLSSKITYAPKQRMS